jgi:hypothetical protein
MGMSNEAKTYVAAVLRRAAAGGRMDAMDGIAENLEAVRRGSRRPARARARGGAVRLLAVSKTYGPEAVRAAAAAGSGCSAKTGCRRRRRRSRSVRGIWSGT